MVSTIIPVYNRPDMIQSAVESVLSQEYRPIEIIIVDDGSTDGTIQVCDKLVRENSGTVQMLKQSNSGPGPARENGRLAARGEFIQYLDSDDLLLPNKFKDQVDALRKNPECGIAYGITRLVNFDGDVLAEPFKWSGEQKAQLFPSLLVDRWWSTHTPLYRRSLCDRIGPWSDLRYSQDWEYDARAGELGARLVTTNTLVSEHRVHDELRQTSEGKWLVPSDQLRFFSQLFKSALAVGTSRAMPEMQHFSRWVFFHARKAGIEGEPENAQKLFDLACKAANGMDGGMRTYALMKNILGWKLAGKIAELQKSIAGGKPGPNTFRQSWMD